MYHQTTQPGKTPGYWPWPVRRFGAGAVRFAAALPQKGTYVLPWVGQSQFQTPAYTTVWEDLLCIRG
nr:DUF4113 domain-containing protein [Hymenobacter pini]